MSSFIYDIYLVVISLQQQIKISILVFLDIIISYTIKKEKKILDPICDLLIKTRESQG